MGHTPVDAGIHRARKVSVCVCAQPVVISMRLWLGVCVPCPCTTQPGLSCVEYVTSAGPALKLGGAAGVWGIAGGSGVLRVHGWADGGHEVLCACLWRVAQAVAHSL